MGQEPLENAKQKARHMPTIEVIDRDGTSHHLEAKTGWKLMEVIRDQGLPIEAACGGCASCATCHVYVDAAWAEKLPAKSEEEEDMLDLALEVQATSRLSCQVEVTEALDGLKVTLAPD